jgi:hypothetical protein
MPRFRHLASLIGLALVSLTACSAAPDDATASSSEALFLPPPPPPPIREVPMCNYDTPASPAGSYVLAWATAEGPNGCPAIADPNGSGTWAEIGSVEPIGNITWGFNGVPTNFTFSLNTPVPSCTAAGLGANCCTYVWWPVRYLTNPEQTNPTMQDPAALCTATGQTFVAITESASSSSPPPPDGGPIIIILPGGGGCVSCNRT